MIPGKTRANNGILGLSLLGDLTIFNASTADAQTIVDVSGYFREQSVSRKTFVYSPELHLLAETNATTSTPSPLYEYVWFGGRAVAQETVSDPSGLRYTMTDHLGTPLLQTNAAGAIVWRAEHEPFGSVYGYRAGTASDHQPLRLPGQEERASSPDRLYNIFRWYRQDLGLYSQPDPIGLQGGINLFGYVGGNPLLGIDPTGLKVYRCCRNIEVNWFANAVSRVFGLKHCFIKTDTIEAGMGPADNGPLPACPMGVKTAIISHTGQAGRSGTDCQELPNVDEDCVNRKLVVGTPSGRWTPRNQCNSFVNGVVDDCRMRNCGFRLFPDPTMWAIP
jgi:RHS repeat-associated protein